MKKLFLLFLTAFLVSLAALCSAAGGRVVYADKGKRFFVVQTQRYAQYSGLKVNFYLSRFPQVGDVVEGDIDRYGSCEVLDVTNHARFRAWVEKVHMDKARAFDYISSK